MTGGFISKIQRYSTKDGPGLRSTVFLVGCNLNCVWCANPELIAPGRKFLYFAERCVKCGRCASIAANNAIILTENGCKIDREACINIEECASACYYDAYEAVGYEISSRELCEKLMRDKDFYDQSVGGVTFSGGEPALQAEFVIETSKLLRDSGVHVALDTAGLASHDVMKELLESVDLVLFDIKAMDSETHFACTGVYNDAILNNARLIAANNTPMIIRLIIVPGYNDDKSDFQRRLEVIKELGSAVKRVDILKHHKLGEGKSLRIGRANTLNGVSEQSDEYISEYAQMALEMGIAATIGG